MGWAYGKNLEGRDIGYGVEATCDHPGCEAKIDRGLSYLCGGPKWESGEGCGKYFCDDHLGYHFRANDDDEDGEEMSCQLCEECGEEWEDGGEVSHA